MTSPEKPTTARTRSRFLLPCVAVASLSSIASADIYFTEYLNNTTNGDEDTYEWCEIYNAGTTAVDLTGWSFADNTSGGVIETFGIIKPGAFMIIAKNAQAWANTWTPGDVGSTAHEWTGENLSNTADALNLFDAAGVLQAHLSYCRWRNARQECVLRRSIRRVRNQRDLSG